MDEKYILKIQANEDRSKTNEQRIDALEDKTQNNTELALSVKELTVEIKYMRKDYQELAKKHTDEVKAIVTRLNEIEKKPVDNWEKLKWIIITGIVTAILGFLLGKTGL